MTEASVPAGDAGQADAADSTATAAPARPTPLWLAVTIAVLFGMLYAYDVWEAVDSLVQLSTYASTIGGQLSGVALSLTILAIVVPLAVFGIAFWLGYRRGPLAQILIYLAGYALAQVLFLDLSAFIPSVVIDLP
ncbi:hypothetical protein [Agromyces bauzanensis]